MLVRWPLAIAAAAAMLYGLSVFVGGLPAPSDPAGKCFNNGGRSDDTYNC